MTTKTVEVSSQVYTVKWVQVKDRFVRFHECEKPNDVAENVDISWLMENDKVNVQITDGIVTYLAVLDNKTDVQKLSALNAEIKGENTVEQTYTIKGMHSKKGGAVIFKEVENVWYSPAKSVNLSAFNKGDVVKVVIEPAKGKSNATITSMTKVEKKVPEPVVETPATETWSGTSGGVTTILKTTSSSYTRPAPENEKDAFYRVKQLENQVAYLQTEKQNSIEVQSSVNNAVAVVASMVQGLAPEVVVKNQDVLKKLITEFATHNYTEVQRLKKSV